MVKCVVCFSPHVYFDFLIFLHAFWSNSWRDLIESIVSSGKASGQNCSNTTTAVKKKTEYICSIEQLYLPPSVNAAAGIVV